MVISLFYLITITISLEITGDLEYLREKNQSNWSIFNPVWPSKLTTSFLSVTHCIHVLDICLIAKKVHLEE